MYSDRWVDLRIVYIDMNQVLYSFNCTLYTHITMAYGKLAGVVMLSS